MNIMPIIILGIILSVLIYFCRQFIGAVFGLYRVVPVNEAHIRILRNSKAVFSSRTGKSAYWVIPFMTKLHKLPLCNLAIPVNDVKLNDIKMAKFVTDIMCFVNIKDIDLAVERLTLTSSEKEMGFDFVKLSDDLRAIMESVGRTVTTKQTILDIYMNRSMLDKAITQEVEVVFPKWGIELVDLELKDIKDAPNSTIIHDIEVKVASEIRRDAEIKVAETTREAEIAKAVAEESYLKRRIERDEAVGIAEQTKNQKIAEMTALANIKKVEAQRKLDVGGAEIKKQMIEQEAMAEKIKLTTEAEGEASKVKTVGEAEAAIIQVKKEADAAGTLKLAEAMKQFNDVAINVKVLDINKEIQIAKFNALSVAISKADIKWILSGDNAQKFFGLNLDAQGGANLEQFLRESGLEAFIPAIRELLGKKELSVKK